MAGPDRRDRALAVRMASVTGFTYDTIQDVMGHRRSARQAGITKGYAGPSGLDARRACVEAVILPYGDA